MQGFCSLGRMDPASGQLRERLHLAKDVFFCITAGQGIFLDLRRDTYSSVPVPDDVVGSRGCLSEAALAAAFAPFRQELLDEGLVSQTPVDGRRFGAFQGIRRPSAHLLEPVMVVEVFAPSDFAGDLMGDLNGRRGQIAGMDTRGTHTVIRAHVPMAEMLSYEQTLTATTGGRGGYHMEFHHYAEVPPHLHAKIVQAAHAEGRGGHVEDE